MRVMVVMVGVVQATAFYGVNLKHKNKEHRNAYATVYMGTPRDYEFYVATRVLIRSLIRLQVDADLIVIASLDVPLLWLRALEEEEEDGAKVLRVENVNDPYKGQQRFKLTLNKLYAWRLVDYDGVVMLDADNLFLHKTDELFQYGQFCAVFINPCIFHIYWPLCPSLEVFKDMTHQLETGKANPDGADQGFTGAYFPDLLDQPKFYPHLNGTTLDGHYRLPMGYQMDASYYYLKLGWRVPCAPNSVITFPGAPWLKPWYWWSWPVLSLGIQWHENRRQTLGYAAEMPIVMIPSVIFLGITTMTRLARPSISKLCYRNTDKSSSLMQTGLKFIAIWSIIAAYIVPFAIIPRTIHPLVGWTLYFLGSVTLSSVAINSFLLPVVPILVPLIGVLGSLLVIACPWYPYGVTRALAVFGYAFCYALIAWGSMVKVTARLQVSLEKRTNFPKVG
ncbi:hypothetical protein Goklo_014528 [Gossypium klotzschianum]|uniref:Uncharacterized protein n=1 Tax=Gossypium klotzschianum TaxID=34286 RepID=A0A7J8U864_9ROSI|nr:hypothetical protein [Gossypium klotzschianum]